MIKETRIICFGDSLTEAAAEAEGKKWPTLLQARLEARAPGQFAVYNRGVSGNTSAQGLDRFEQAVLPLLPAWVLVEFGGNDANVRPARRTPRVGVEEFASNLAEIDRMVRAGGGRTLLVAIHPPDPDRRTKEEGRKYEQGNRATYAKNYDPYRKAILKLAKSKNLPLVDISATLKKQKMTVADIVVPDGIHLTTDGNAFYCAAIFDKLAELFRIP